MAPVSAIRVVAAGLAVEEGTTGLGVGIVGGPSCFFIDIDTLLLFGLFL